MEVGDAHVLPGFLTPVLTQRSFQSHRLLFLHASAESERRIYAGKKVGLNRGSNSQPPGHESDMLTTGKCFVSFQNKNAPFKSHRNCLLQIPSIWTKLFFRMGKCITHFLLDLLFFAACSEQILCHERKH